MSNIISTDVSDDLKDRIEEEQEEGESRSAAVRRLIRQGLEDDGIGLPYVLLLFGALTMGIAVTPNVEPAYLLIMGISLSVAGVLLDRWNR